MGSGRLANGQRRPEPDHGVLLRRVIGELLRWPVERTTTTWIPSDESDVFEVATDGAAPRIVKIEQPEAWCVRREELAFPVLREQGFDEFPEIEFSTAALPGASHPFTVMAKAPSRPWPELWSEDRRLAVWTVERIGDFLRRLGQVDWTTVPGVVRPDERVEGFGTWFAMFFAPLFSDGAGLTPAERARVQHVLDAMKVPPDGFGGWQFAQALTDGYLSFVAIDWGNLGAYWPLQDLAAAICTLDAFGDGAAEVLRAPLLDAFTNGKGLDDSQNEQLELWLELWEFFGRAAELRGRV